MARVETSYGTVQGLEFKGHQAFFGIPYAAPPKGEGRWRSPQPPAAWAGVREAVAPGFAAPQTSHPIPGFAASQTQDEDCLFLNVFTPSGGGDGRRRPVLFWIHGGGFTHGGASELLYDGGPLAKRGDVVVVAINYRLGALGFLYLGEHLPGRGLSANCASLDQIAALQWVARNIEAFGGDPANVTIFGESAGAAAVGTLLAMPAAKGLFKRAILQSGTGRASSPDAAIQTVDRMLEQLGLGRDEAEKLLELPAAAIVEAQASAAAKAARSGSPMQFGPVRDGRTVLDAPIDALRAGAAAGIPVLIGTNRDEVKLFASTTRREEIDGPALVAAVQAALPKANVGAAAGLVEVYKTSRAGRGLPVANLDILDAVQTDARFRLPALQLALAQRMHQPDTYAYLFTHASPARHGALGSCHALEMAFVFGTTKASTQLKFVGEGPDVERLEANVMDAWLGFAKGSHPAHEGIGEWPAYDPVLRPTMVFDRASGREDDPFREERRAIEGLM